MLLRYSTKWSLKLASTLYDRQFMRDIFPQFNIRFTNKKKKKEVDFYNKLYNINNFC